MGHIIFGKQPLVKIEGLFVRWLLHCQPSSFRICNVIWRNVFSISFMGAFLSVYINANYIEEKFVFKQRLIMTKRRRWVHTSLFPETLGLGQNFQIPFENIWKQPPFWNLPITLLYSLWKTADNMFLPADSLPSHKSTHPHPIVWGGVGWDDNVISISTWSWCCALWSSLAFPHDLDATLYDLHWHFHMILMLRSMILIGISKCNGTHPHPIVWGGVGCGGVGW